jgi:transposase
MDINEINDFLKSRNYKHVDNYRKKIKERLVDYKGGKCEICGYNKCITALEFHHIEPTKKDFTISNSSVLSFETCKKEVDKCILVCSNCHREIHYNETLKKKLEKEEREKKIFAEIIKNRGDYDIKKIKNSIDYLEDAGIMDDIKNGLSKTEIRKKYHINHDVLKEFLKRNGMTYREKKTVDLKPNKDELCALLKEHSKSAIGRMFNVSCGAVIKWCKKFGI